MENKSCCFFSWLGSGHTSLYLKGHPEALLRPLWLLVASFNAGHMKDLKLKVKLTKLVFFADECSPDE